MGWAPCDIGSWWNVRPKLYTTTSYRFGLSIQVGNPNISSQALQSLGLHYITFSSHTLVILTTELYPECSLESMTWLPITSQAFCPRSCFTENIILSGGNWCTLLVQLHLDLRIWESYGLAIPSFPHGLPQPIFDSHFSHIPNGTSILNKIVGPLYLASAYASFSMPPHTLIGLSWRAAGHECQLFHHSLCQNL